MPRWLAAVLPRIRRLATAGRLRFTLKALRELAGLGLDFTDAAEIVAGLTMEESAAASVRLLRGVALHLQARGHGYGAVREAGGPRRVRGGLVPRRPGGRS